MEWEMSLRASHPTECLTFAPGRVSPCLDTVSRHPSLLKSKWKYMFLKGIGAMHSHVYKRITIGLFRIFENYDLLA